MPPALTSARSSTRRPTKSLKSTLGWWMTPAVSWRRLCAPVTRRTKPLEQGLHSQIRVLEGIRRDVTVIHLDLAEKALAAANRVRHQALNALIGDGKILKEPPGVSKNPPKKI